MEKIKRIIIILALSILLFSHTVNAEDIFATTDDGRKVILHDNGKWEFVREQKRAESKSALSSSTDENNLKIIEIDYKINERNQVWWKYAWRLTIVNPKPLEVNVNATIEFQDKIGFVIDDNEYCLHIPAKGQKTFTGYKLITASVAPNVAQISAKVNTE